MTLEISRFEDANEYEYEIKLKVFARVLKKRLPESFIFLFFFHQKKLIRLFILKEVKPSPDSKVKELLTSDNLFAPLRHDR